MQLWPFLLIKFHRLFFIEPLKDESTKSLSSDKPITQPEIVQIFKIHGASIENLANFKYDVPYVGLLITLTFYFGNVYMYSFMLKFCDKKHFSLFL